jgi:hypothetical protein
MFKAANDNENVAVGLQRGKTYVGVLPGDKQDNSNKFHSDLNDNSGEVGIDGRKRASSVKDEHQDDLFDSHK